MAYGDTKYVCICLYVFSSAYENLQFADKVNSTNIQNNIILVFNCFVISNYYLSMYYCNVSLTLYDSSIDQ